jgi:putative sugar O-methyltransferase
MPLQRLRHLAFEALQLRRDLPALMVWSRRLRKDPNFNFVNVDRGLEPRVATVATNEKDRLRIAERIMDAYAKAAGELKKRSALYRVSNEWVPLFNKPLQPLLLALQTRDARRLQLLLDNFFRNSISAGLCGLATDMEAAFFKKAPNGYRRRQLLVDGLYRYRLLQELMPGVHASALAIPDVGNPYGLVLDGSFVRNGADYLYYYAHQVLAELAAAPVQRATVLELGGGVGGFAYFLHSLSRAPISYVNVDLPEILCISSYQLLNLFPAKNFVLYGENNAPIAQAIAESDIALLPTFSIEAIPDDSIDVAFNSYSLAEMAPESIRNYVDHIGRTTRTAILHVNHVSNALVGADEFPFDMRKFEVRRRSRACWNLGRNLRSDEFEFLLRRRVRQLELEP